MREENTRTWKCLTTGEYIEEDIMDRRLEPGELFACTIQYWVRNHDREVFKGALVIMDEVHAMF